MPSPFPGMDPYLEDPSLWPDVHHEWISVMREVLGAKLRPAYSVRIEERVYLADLADLDRTLGVRVPDVAVTPAPEHGTPARFDPGGGTALVVETEPILATTGPEEVHEAFLSIIDAQARRVVTIIEVLSPANKLADSPGLESFERKRREVMISTSHWVEIDLLRGGRSLPARDRLMRPCDYLVHVSPALSRPQGRLWPIALDRRLPVVGVPLKAEDADCPLDLQAVLNTVYERAGYDLELDYTREPVPPLDAAWSSWADRLLKERGLRQGRGTNR